MTGRIIHLRRPPVLNHADGVFVPDVGPAQLEVAETRWTALRGSNPACYDGRLLHVLGVHRNGHGGCVMHVVDCAYRFHAVQDESFDLGVRPLGVKGITRCAGRFLMGLRSARVANYRDQWEFAPGGVVEPDARPAAAVIRELLEETGLTSRAEPTPMAVLFDPVLRCWEIAYRIDVDEEDVRPGRDEYAELRWCAADDLPEPLSPIARQMKELIKGS